MFGEGVDRRSVERVVGAVGEVGGGKEEGEEGGVEGEGEGELESLEVEVAWDWMDADADEVRKTPTSPHERDEIKLIDLI